MFCQLLAFQTYGRSEMLPECFLFTNVVCQGMLWSFDLLTPKAISEAFFQGNR